MLNRFSQGATDASRRELVSIWQRGTEMTFGIGNLVALISIVISIIFAIVTHQAANALWWALLAIFAVLWWDARAPWGRP